MVDGIRKNDLVLVVDEMIPRSVWLMEIVLDAKKGRDGLVRSACVKTESLEADISD